MGYMGKVRKADRILRTMDLLTLSIWIEGNVTNVKCLNGEHNEPY
jgi:hypothetical protein